MHADQRSIVAMKNERHLFSYKIQFYEATSHNIVPQTLQKMFRCFLLRSPAAVLAAEI